MLDVYLYECILGNLLCTHEVDFGEIEYTIELSVSFDTGSKFYENG